MTDKNRRQQPLGYSLVVMGVSGCGKSAVGSLLAERLGLPFIEGDAFHPQENIDKMSAGIALGDAEREPWLLKLQECLRAYRARGEDVVLACSALKRRYRDILRGGSDLVFIHLDGSRELLASRMQGRSGHFMPTALLDSQYRDLEPLQPDERGMRLDVSEPPPRLVERVLEQLP